MKVCVYAICKNEAQFARRWMASMSEADGVYVLDTGSDDGTPQLLRSLGAVVAEEVIDPWRFDVARNRSMELLPGDADICVCTDLDEVFHPGWRGRLESVWTSGAGQATCRYTWSFQADGSEGIVFWCEKIHARQGYVWTHPVHEVLTWTGAGSAGPTVAAVGVQLDHHPDPNKSREQYLGLLEQSVLEAPEDDRNMHYLGREYLFRGRWDDCITALERHLAMPSAVWADERAASMRYIAKALLEKGEPEQARDWYLRAIAEAPHLREAYLDLAMLLYQQERWNGVLYFTNCALEISARPKTYISEAAAWGSLPYDLQAIALFQTGRTREALDAAKQAFLLEPGNERLRENVAILDHLVKKGA